MIRSALMGRVLGCRLTKFEPAAIREGKGREGKGNLAIARV